MSKVESGKQHAQEVRAGVSHHSETRTDQAKSVTGNATADLTKSEQMLPGASMELVQAMLREMLQALMDERVATAWKGKVSKRGRWILNVPPST